MVNTSIEETIATAVPNRLRTDRTGRPYEIQELRPCDVADLERFYDEFEPKRAAQGLPPEGLDRIRRWLRSVIGSGLHLVAVSGGELVGHAFIVPTSRPGIGEYAVFLRQDLRGRGIGTELNRAVVEEARKAGWKGLWLSVQPRNRPAIRSYEKVGFRFIPETLLTMEAEMELDLAEPAG